MDERPDDTALERVAEALRVAGVPLRLAILTAIERHGAMSPSGFARRSDGAHSLRTAAYHFRFLRDGGLVVLDDLSTTGGTAEHFYVLSPLGRAIVRALPRLQAVAA